MFGDAALTRIEEMVVALMERRDTTEAMFAEVAAAVFAYQWSVNEHLRRYWRGRGWRVDASGISTHNTTLVSIERGWDEHLAFVLDTLQSPSATSSSLPPIPSRWWRNVPGVPTDVFRRVDLRDNNASRLAATFRTSGTTFGERGVHHKTSMRLYDEGAWRFFREMVDLGSTSNVRVAALVHDPAIVGDSSLSYMVALIAREMGAAARYFVGTPPDDQSGVVDAPSFAQWCGASDDPVLVFGTAFALVELFERSTWNIHLPAGSAVIETGGYKGRVRAWSRSELYAAIESRLAVPKHRIASEYSMTELSSQLYSVELCDHRVEPSAAGGAGANEGLDGRVFVAPPWCRVDAVDAETLAPLEPGERGILRFLDLANADSVWAVQTSDLGTVLETGEVVLFGRSPGAIPRGCSLAIEELVTWTR